MSDKVTAQINIPLAEKGQLLPNETKIAKTFRDFLKIVINQLGISRYRVKFNDEAELLIILVDVEIQKFKNHLSAKLVRDIFILCDMFKFESVSPDDIIREVTKLNIAKNGILKNIPTRRLGEVSDISIPFLTQIWSTIIILI